MGFLDSIGTLLGGFNDARQIDSDGFDFRQKRQQAEFERQRQRAEEGRAAQEFQRKQEEDLVSQGADVLTGAPQGGDAGPLPEPDLASMLPQEVSAEKRKWIASRSAGKALQSKSALAGQNASTRLMLQQLAGSQRLDQIDASGGEAQELARIKAEIDAGRKLSPRDQAMLASAEKRAAARGGGSGGGGGRPQLRLVSDGQGGAEYRWISPGETAAGAPTATQRETAGMAVSVDDALSRMEKLATDVSYGPIEGRASLAFQSQYPGGPEMEFDALKNRLIDLAYIQSGKQINRLEIELKINQLVNRAKGNLPEQVRLAKDYINSALLPYRRSGAVKPTPGGGGGAPQPIRSQAEWDALPSGAKYLGSDGRGRTKP